jgi:hypothetical protein
MAMYFELEVKTNLHAFVNSELAEVIYSSANRRSAHAGTPWTGA